MVETQIACRRIGWPTF